MGGRGRGWGRRGTAPRPATGRRRAHFHRGGAPRPAPGRLGRPAGKVARGAPPPSLTAAAAAGPPPECYSPPAAALAESRGRGSQTCRRALPLPALSPAGRSREGAFPAGARRCSTPPRPPRPAAGGVRGAGPPLPRRDRSPTPARLQPGGSGRGGLSPVRPGRVAPSGPGGLSVTPVGEASARGQRRCRPPTRPVLKHGPRSLTRARVRGSHESRRGAMKVKAALAGGRGGIPRPLQSAEGAPPARLARRAGEVEHERTC